MPHDSPQHPDPQQTDSHPSDSLHPDAAEPVAAEPGLSHPSLPTLAAQAQRLIDLGVHEIAGLDPQQLRDAADVWGSDRTDALLVVRPDLAPPSALAPLMRRGGKPGFVVVDMDDVDDFAPTGIELPGDGPTYLLEDPSRGEDFENMTPQEALPEILARGRTPLLLTEGIHWALQVPEIIAPGHCFMTIGSRRLKLGGKHDARTPALWISGGTGRDGKDRRGAPKVGWCWWGNRHTWLGIASADGRSGRP